MMFLLNFLWNINFPRFGIQTVDTRRHMSQNLGIQGPDSPSCCSKLLFQVAVQIAILVRIKMALNCFLYRPYILRVGVCLRTGCASRSLRFHRYFDFDTDILLCVKDLSFSMATLHGEVFTMKCSPWTGTFNMNLGGGDLKQQLEQQLRRFAWQFRCWVANSNLENRAPDFLPANRKNRGNTPASNQAECSLQCRLPTFTRLVDLSNLKTALAGFSNSISEIIYFLSNLYLLICRNWTFST